MVDLEKFHSLDAALMDASKQLKPLFYVNPVNETEEREKFFASQTCNPSFEYRPLKYSPAVLTLQLQSVVIPSCTIGKIFQEKRRNMLLSNKVIANRGNPEVVQNATIAVHGRPNEALVDYAVDLLQEIPNVVAEKTIPSSKVKQSLEEALIQHGLVDWRVELADKRLTTVNAAEKKISVCKDRLFAANDPARLVVHEVGVHALRAANGYAQPLNIFAVGLPGYLPTEEGLTSYFEEQTGTANEETLRDYAARVIAVDSVCNGLNFRQTFDRLKDHNLTQDQAWNLSVRAHRGGGYVKDHVYLDGLLRVRDFAENEGDFATLYVGKVGIEHLPLVRQLLQEGVLKEAVHAPKFIKK